MKRLVLIVLITLIAMPLLTACEEEESPREKAVKEYISAFRDNAPREMNAVLCMPQPGAMGDPDAPAQNQLQYYLDREKMKGLSYSETEIDASQYEVKLSGQTEHVVGQWNKFEVTFTVVEQRGEWCISEVTRPVKE
jgi:hypothetical protein